MKQLHVGRGSVNATFHLAIPYHRIEPVVQYSTITLQHYDLDDLS